METSCQASRKDPTFNLEMDVQTNFGNANILKAPVTTNPPLLRSPKIHEVQSFCGGDLVATPYCWIDRFSAVTDSTLTFDIYIYSKSNQRDLWPLRHLTKVNLKVLPTDGPTNNQRTNPLTGVGARDVYASKNDVLWSFLWKVSPWSMWMSQWLRYSYLQGFYLPKADTAAAVVVGGFLWMVICCISRDGENQSDEDNKCDDDDSNNVATTLGTTNSFSNSWISRHFTLSFSLWLVSDRQREGE